MAITIVMAEARSQTARAVLDEAASAFAGEREVTTMLESAKAEKVIPRIVEQTPGALLLMGAYGHSPIRRMILGSTTRTMLQTVKAPVLLVR